MTGEPGTMLVPLAAPRGRTTWTFRHAGRSYAAFVVGGQLRVTDAACPHNGGPLAEGTVRNGVVTCPRHWYRFDLSTGRCLTTAEYELRLYPVTQRDGQSFVALPSAVRSTRRWSQWLRGHTRPNREQP